MLYKFDISIHSIPEEPEPKPVVKKSKGKIWRWPWRIKMLALPKRPISKYVPPPRWAPRKFGPINPNAVFRNDHLSRAPLRTLYENKRAFKSQGPRFVARVDKNIEKSWGAIYNYYKKILRHRQLLKRKKKMEKMKAKKLKGKDLQKLEEEQQQHFAQLATPKKLFLPEKIIRKRVPLEDLLPTINVLAQPKERVIIPPRAIDVVSRAALTYEITEQVMRLYTSGLETMKKRQPPPPLVLGRVSRAALRAKCSPRIEAMAQPSLSAREAKKKDEDMYDPWVISKNALKYKPTPRILELAKPLERE